MHNCTLSDNSGSAGGAITNDQGTLTLTQCTLSGNSADQGGGAIQNVNGTLTLTHCTLSGNVARIHGGGGITNVGILTQENSIVAANSAPFVMWAADIDNLGTVIRVGANLVQSYNSSGVGTDTGPIAINAPPDLLPLGNYGGPTQTRPPRAGSPVIDTALGSTTNVDQRGLPRPINGDLLGPAVRDIGACEFQDLVEVTTTADELDTPAGAARSLREAVRDVPNGGLIHFSPLVFNGLTPSSNTITLSLATIFTPPREISISAINIPAGVTVDGNNATRLFYIDVNCEVSMHGLTLTRGNVEGHGGAIYTLGTLKLSHCTLSNNTAYYAGAIRSHTSYDFTTSSTRLTHCTVSGNTATIQGGGIRNFEGLTVLTHCTISGNTAPAGEGSGVANYGDNDTQTMVVNSIIAGNTNSDVDIFSGGANSFTSQGNNLIGVGNATGDFNQTGDTTGVTNPLLAPLGNYGGPTQTMALKAGSLARNGASGSTATSDQRGFPIVGVPDIGAYEAGTNTNYNAWIWETLPVTATEPQHASTFDYDGDAASNEAEWLALTDPTNGADYFEVISTLSSPNSLTLTYASKTGRNYQRQTSLNMMTWTNDGAPIPGNDTTDIWTPTITSLTRQFYRVVPSLP